MNYNEIIELIEKIDSSANITGVKIKDGDFAIRIRKSPHEIKPIARPTETKVEKVVEVTQTNDFVTASTLTASSDPNIASPGQVKYARDMVGKKFEGNMDASVDWLAHLMEVPLSDVPHPSTWDTTLTKDMAGTILDNLEGKRG